MYDILIIGAGPAGVSAAVYAASRGRTVLLIEKSKVGGLVGNVSSVTHYASVDGDETGASFAEKLSDQLTRYPTIETVFGTVESVDMEGDIKRVIADTGAYEGKRLIIAAGCAPRKLHVPNEDRLAGHGVDLNAPRDAERYRGKNIYVVGGADGAIKEALYLADFAKKLTIIHWEDQIGCIAEFKDRLAQLGNVEYRLHARLAAVDGADEVESLVLRDEHTGDEETIADPGCGIFIYAGTVPNTQGLEALGLQDGFIPVNEKMETTIAGVYAAGDIRAKQVRQASTAVSDGTIAAINASASLK
ncbi:NAD(P)/FAD-dependent oxidoreductase [Curtanaerobium respiraculi]|uniref:NAD(P)/FAD-dependent oxidoreductase n=1 Tax=Curtanaerobium respiraculi TaxID=2949669 RepID=UPI0024B32509|nr:NAD(P)/FAD-dependent oxidoreductase [Curtanaerobium respiraculi]